MYKVCKHKILNVINSLILTYITITYCIRPTVRPFLLYRTQVHQVAPLPFGIFLRIFSYNLKLKNYRCYHSTLNLRLQLKVLFKVFLFKFKFEVQLLHTKRCVRQLGIEALRIFQQNTSYHSKIKFIRCFFNVGKQVGLRQVGL